MFKLESQMLETILQAVGPLVSQFYGASSAAIATELPFNHRMIDVAVAPVDVSALEQLRETPACQNIAKSLSRLRIVDLDVLGLFVSGEPVSIHKIRSQTFLATETLKANYIDRLVTLGLVEQRSKFTYASTGWSSAVPPRILAIEAKLSRWQEALEQAVYNLQFADRSLVALDATQLRVSCLEHFEREGVGLLLVHSDGWAELKIPPKAKKSLQRCTDHQRVRVLRDLLLTQRAKWKIADLINP